MAGNKGKKIGMTSVYSAEGKNLPCTIIEAGPCVVTQIKTQEKDGYESVQLGFEDKKEKNTPKAMLGHFSKAKTSPKRKIVEVKGLNEVNLGDLVTVDQFQEGEFVDVVGTSSYYLVLHATSFQSFLQVTDVVAFYFLLELSLN